MSTGPDLAAQGLLTPKQTTPEDDNVLNQAAKWLKFLGVPSGVGEVSMFANINIQNAGLSADKQIGFLEMFNARGGKLAELFAKVFKKEGGDIKNLADGIMAMSPPESMNYGSGVEISPANLGNFSPPSIGDMSRGAGIDLA